jgi:hypothetical protein
MAGKDQAKKDAVQLVSNRHGALEKYEKYAVRDLLGKKASGIALGLGYRLPDNGGFTCAGHARKQISLTH